MKIQYLPNLITTFRIIGTAILLFLPILGPAFFVIYTLCGISDVLDGWIARSAHVTSELGARLDSIADMLFYAVMLLKIFPILFENLPIWIWYWVSAVLILRAAAYCAAAVKFHHFSSLHTYLNKLTGFLVFCVPYLIKTPVLTPCCIGVCAVALLAALEELLMHLCNKEYCEGKHTLLQCFFKQT